MSCNNQQTSLVEVKVAKSECPMMPADTVLILEGPQINYEKSGPVCLSAINAIYPWIMITRHGIRDPKMEWDAEKKCYPVVCPCGIVRFEIRNLRDA